MTLTVAIVIAFLVLLFIVIAIYTDSATAALALGEILSLIVECCAAAL